MIYMMKKDRHSCRKKKTGASNFGDQISVMTRVSIIYRYILENDGEHCVIFNPSSRQINPDITAGDSCPG